MLQSKIESKKKPQTRLHVDLNYLKSHLSWIPHWEDLLNNSINRSGQSLEPDDELIIYIRDPDFVSTFKYILDNTPRRVLANYMFYKALISMLEYIVHDFNTPLREIPYSSKEDFCLKMVSKVFEKAIAVTYLNNYATPQSLEGIRNIVENIKAQYLKELIKVGYPQLTIQNVVKFYETMEIIYGYDKRLINNSTIDAYYAYLHPGQASFYQLMLLAVKRAKEDRKLNNEELLTKLAANAYFDPYTKDISISAPLMEATFVSLEYPWAINYGRFGFIFAHELAHGLLFNPLNEAQRTKQNEECILRQYGNITVYEPDVMVGLILCFFFVHEIRQL